LFCRKADREKVDTDLTTTNHGHECREDGYNPQRERLKMREEGPMRLCMNPKCGGHSGPQHTRTVVGRYAQEPRFFLDKNLFTTRTVIVWETYVVEGFVVQYNRYAGPPGTVKVFLCEDCHRAIQRVLRGDARRAVLREVYTHARAAAPNN
jgi:hypothetical protein